MRELFKRARGPNLIDDPNITDKEIAALAGIDSPYRMSLWAAKYPTRAAAAAQIKSAWEKPATPAGDSSPVTDDPSPTSPPDTQQDATESPESDSGKLTPLPQQQPLENSGQDAEDGTRVLVASAERSEYAGKDGFILYDDKTHMVLHATMDDMRRHAPHRWQAYITTWKDWATSEVHDFGEEGRGRLILFYTEGEPDELDAPVRAITKMEADTPF